jgi:hypothetical protein
MYVPLARPDYYRASAPPSGQQLATSLPTTRPAAWQPGRPRAVPTFTRSSIGQAGTQLYPGSIATPTPQTFNVASPPPAAHGFGVDPRHPPAVTHCTPGPYPPDLSQALVTRLQPLIHSRYATDLASRTRTVWQYRHVPALSGLLPTLTSVPQIRLPPASTRPPRRPERKGLSPLSTIQRLVAHTADKYSSTNGWERLRPTAANQRPGPTTPQ